jgi:hypothetical protein
MRDEKFKLYDTAFKIGFVFNILIFVGLNFISYKRAIIEEKQLLASGIDLSPCCIGPSWGFPFDMTRFETFSLNFVIIAFCGFIVGLIFKFVWSKFTSKQLK